MVTKVCSKLSNIQSRHLSEVFKNKNVILSQKQPKNLLWLFLWARCNTEINAFQQQKGLFKCIDKRCSVYVAEGHSFIMSCFLSDLFTECIYIYIYRYIYIYTYICMYKF